MECSARANELSARAAERAQQERRELDRCLEGAPAAPATASPAAGEAGDRAADEESRGAQ